MYYSIMCICIHDTVVFNMYSLNETRTNPTVAVQNIRGVMHM